MFTGIIQEIGIVAGVRQSGDGIELTIDAPQTSRELAVDDSVAINGVCQTVVRKNGNLFSVQAVKETLAKTTLHGLSARSPVNLELAMRLGDRLGGHLVLGHVDGVGTVKSIEKQEGSWLYTLEIPSAFLRYLIPVGSIAVDGVSLTVARLEDPLVTVSIIPHTFENTIFHALHVGSKVNLEFDMIGKYIERLLLPTADGKSTLNAEKLRSWGFGE